MAVTVITQQGTNREVFNIKDAEGWIIDDHGLSVVNANKGEIARFPQYTAIFLGTAS